MKAFITLTLAFFLFHIPAFAQFPHSLMPGQVFGTLDDDTILNKRENLQKSGIKKIYAYQTASENLKTHTSKTTILNERGNIESITACFPKNEHTNAWCILDTFLYDDPGQLKEMKVIDAKGNEISQSIFEYIGKRELKFYSIAKMQNKQWDTLVDHRYFNQKGQMVKLMQIRKERPAESSLYYYNADGLLDSVQYENSSLPTLIFIRSEKGKKKLIEAQFQSSKFKWLFNQSGQCISMEVVTTSPPRSSYSGTLKNKTEFHYNADGTLSKVSLKRSNGVKATMHYTYSK
jgi:hypothetical protein